MIFITDTSKSQTATTFTASDIMVTNTITAGGPIRGQCITANDTLRAKDQVVAEQDLKVAGDINLAGSLFLNYSSGLKVVAPNTITGNGPIVVMGNTSPPIGGDDPSACVVNTSGWLTPGPALGFFTSFNIGASKSTLSMLVENNGGVGNGYIDIGGSLNGSTPGDLFINNKCVRNTKINLAGGTVFMGDQVRMNKFVEIGSLGGATTGFGQPLFKIYINGGTGMEVVTSNNNTKALSVINTAGNNYPFEVYGDGKTKIGVSAMSPYRQLTVNGDCSFANYGTNTTNGFNGMEILGNSQIPTRRGISLDQDPNGDMNFFINNYQSINGLPEFRFKNGIQLNGQPATNYANAPDLMVLNGNALLSLKSYGTVTNVTNAFEIFNVADNTANFKVKSNGFVYAREVRVMTGTFPDYVFTKNYNLLSITDLDIYINKNKHLPGYEKAEYYIENGINTSEMFVKQQETIENLTLYIIELEKRLSKLEKK